MRLLLGDSLAVLKTLESESVQCCVTSPTVLAYLAGVIDSDGTIGIKKSTYAVRVTKDSGQPTYSERICVKQVTPEAVDILHSTFGGSRYIGQPSAKKGRALFVWQVTDRKAALALAVLATFLRIKKEQASNCLRLREIKEASKRERVLPGRGHVGSAARSDTASAEMEALYQRAHELNKVGV